MHNPTLPPPDPCFSLHWLCTLTRGGAIRCELSSAAVSTRVLLLPCLCHWWTGSHKIVGVFRIQIHSPVNGGSTVFSKGQVAKTHHEWVSTFPHLPVPKGVSSALAHSLFVEFALNLFFSSLVLSNPNKSQGNLIIMN